MDSKINDTNMLSKREFGAIEKWAAHNLQKNLTISQIAREFNLGFDQARMAYAKLLGKKLCEILRIDVGGDHGGTG